MHKCRKCLLNYLQTEEEKSDSTFAMIGTIIHEGFIPYFEKGEKMRVIHREKRLEDELFTGHIDGYVQKTKQLFELKTVSTWIYGDLIEPKIEHIQQSCLYSILGGYESVKFCYLNRDTGEYKTFDMDLTTNEMNAIKLSLISKAKEVYKLYEDGKTTDDIDLDPFETCDNYCEFLERPADKAPSIDGGIKDIEDMENKSELKGYLYEYQKANELEKEAKKTKFQYANIIKETMEKSDLREITDFAIYYRNERKSFDSKAFQKEEPELYEKYIKSSPSVYFRVKG